MTKSIERYYMRVTLANRTCLQETHHLTDSKLTKKKKRVWTYQKVGSGLIKQTNKQTKKGRKRDCKRLDRGSARKQLSQWSRGSLWRRTSVTWPTKFVYVRLMFPTSGQMSYWYAIEEVIVRSYLRLPGHRVCVCVCVCVCVYVCVCVFEILVWLQSCMYDTWITLCIVFCHGTKFSI